MSYQDTARAFVQAESNNHPAHGGQAAEVLRMSTWAENLREQMTPQTVAHNHAFHVSDVAHDLRMVLADPPPPDRLAITLDDLNRYRAIEYNARKLLAAIGEGVSA